MFNWEILTSLIPPAIVVTFMVFCVKFFGKAVSDQKPFADDRDWQRELDGVNFFTRNILSPIIGVLIFRSKNFNPFLFTKYDFLLILLSLVVIATLLVVNKQAHKFLKNNKLDDDKMKASFNRSILSLISFGIILLLIQFFSKEMYFYFISGSIYFIIYLVAVAIYESLKNENIFIANIYFIDKTKMNNCRIMKINDITSTLPLTYATASVEAG